MALKGKGVVLAGLAAGAVSLLRKKENRDKVMSYLNQAKEKVNSSGGVQGLMDKAPSNTAANMEIGNEVGIVSADLAETAANSLQVDENKFISEGGAQKAINDYNHQQK